jgi:hypothetical protein
MEIRIKRIALKETYTIGRLYVDGEYICDTIEDKVRDIKIQNETAIPYGRYKVAMNYKSPKYSNFDKYKWAKEYDGYLPRLIDVPEFDGILIHVGNTSLDTSGCILVGENKEKGKVINSVATFNRLMKDYLLKAKEKNENIWIVIE